MQPRHAVGVMVILAIAAFLGAFAGFRSAALSAQAHTATSTAPRHATVAARIHQLDRYQISLRRLLHAHPPRLPRMPHFKPVPRPPAMPTPTPTVVSRAAPMSAPPTRVVYVRPHRVVVVHRKHGEHEGADHEGGGHDGGGDD